jgi:hypothetical protein
MAVPAPAQGGSNTGTKAKGQGPAVKGGTGSPVLALGLEILVAGIVIIIAGVSDQAGKMVSLFLFGLLMVFLIAHPQVMQHFSNIVGNLPSQAVK